MTSPAKQFRQIFDVGREVINWYPGHMKHSFTHMQAKMRQVDCIVELHDSRVPFSGRNALFLKSLIGSKPHVLVLNKVDLIDESSRRSIISRYKEEQDNVVFSNCLDQTCKGLRKIVPLLLKLINEQCKMPKSGDARYRVMVAGIPNVGKSSFINALRSRNLHKGRATPVGAVAGVTKSVMNDIKINSEPPLYLIDTPGILCPQILDIESGMKLALCGCLKDEFVGIALIADFLLYWMNKTQNFKYVNILNLKEPTDKIFPLLIKIASDSNHTMRIKDISTGKNHTVPNTQYAAQHLVKLYRKGAFGDLNLDNLSEGDL
ncbi:hypothetical protein RUM44_011529 [Polyplax serrata]|uniref:Mitochondrial GTPase 1 n=1 Tax=Polyplax serrata TaxID=468196 RepID=A0ABR1AQ93_POLSC